jgi:hypothetical protein
MLILASKLETIINHWHFRRYSLERRLLERKSRTIPQDSATMRLFKKTSSCSAKSPKMLTPLVAKQPLEALLLDSPVASLRLISAHLQLTGVGNGIST